MRYNIYFDISAIILILAIAVYFFSNSNIKNQKTISFARMMTLTLVAAICDLVSIYLDINFASFPEWVHYLVAGLYLINVNAVAVPYFVCIYVLTMKGEPIRRKWMGAILAPFLIVMFLVASSYWTNLVYFYDKMGVYQHGPIYNILYLVSGGYLVAALARSIYYRKRFSGSQAACVVGYSTVIYLTILFQAFHPEQMFIQYGEAVACLIILFSLENPADYRDVSLGVYNARGFYEVYRYMVNLDKQFKVLAVEFEGIKEIGSIFGAAIKNSIMSEIANYFKSLKHAHSVFQISENVFCVLANKGPEEWEDIQARITERCAQSFEYVDARVSLNVRMCMINNPNDTKNPDDAVDLIRFALKKASRNYGKAVVNADEVVLADGRREAFILQAIKKAIEEDGLKVFYQPIYSTKEGRFVRAEALVRLEDDTLGRIGPDEFIPIAERNGLITDVGAQVFTKVCMMLNKHRLWEKGIDRIDINLSAIQCMQDDLAERLIDIMDAYSVPYKAVNFEITETAAIISEANLRKNMEKLLEKGVSFAMDDYGSGYSNTVTIIDNPFADVKLDKSMIWSAMVKPQAMQALKHTVEMLKDMGFEIIAEGVETLEMAAKLQVFGCELHQGYYYAKALREDEFLSMVNAG